MLTPVFVLELLSLMDFDVTIEINQLLLQKMCCFFCACMDMSTVENSDIYNFGYFSHVFILWQFYCQTDTMISLLLIMYFFG